MLLEVSFLIFETAWEKVLVILVKVMYVLVLYVGWQMLPTTSLKNQMKWSQHMFQTVEGNEIKEEISEDLLEGLNELDQVKNEESEAITSQGLEAEHHALAAQ